MSQLNDYGTAAASKKYNPSNINEINSKIDELIDETSKLSVQNHFYHHLIILKTF